MEATLEAALVLSAFPPADIYAELAAGCTATTLDALFALQRRHHRARSGEGTSWHRSSDVDGLLAEAVDRLGGGLDRTALVAATSSARFGDPRDRARTILDTLGRAGSPVERALVTALALHC